MLPLHQAHMVGDPGRWVPYNKEKEDLDNPDLVAGAGLEPASTAYEAVLGPLQLPRHMSSA